MPRLNTDALQFIENLSGNLLIAHPKLRDPIFSESIIFLSTQQNEDSIFGLILNRPLNKSIADIAPTFSEALLLDVPVYHGGPVQADQIVLTASKCSLIEGGFQFHFGLTPRQAVELLLQDPQLAVKAYLGYAGWSAQQIIREIQHEDWVITQPSSSIFQSATRRDWNKLISRINPEFRFLADVPDDPSLN